MLSRLNLSYSLRRYHPYNPEDPDYQNTPAVATTKAPLERRRSVTLERDRLRPARNQEC